MKATRDWILGSNDQGESPAATALLPGVVCGQFWLGPALAGRAISLWADTTVRHLLRNGNPLKTVPSRQSLNQLQQRLAAGGRPAGPLPESPPHRSSVEAATGQARVEMIGQPCGHEITVAYAADCEPASSATGRLSIPPRIGDGLNPLTIR